MTGQALLDVSQSDAPLATASQRHIRAANAGVSDLEYKLAILIAVLVEHRGDPHFTAQALRGNAVLDSVLDERLQEKGRNLRAPHPRGNIASDAQPVLESRALDVEVRFDHFELPAERRKLAVRSQHAAEQCCETHQGREGARRGGVNQISDGCESIEEEMRVDLSAERP